MAKLDVLCSTQKGLHYLNMKCYIREIHLGASSNVGKHLHVNLLFLNSKGNEIKKTHSN